MAKPRRRPNMTEKLAAALCELRRGDDWLIPEHLRLRGTAKEICAYVQWDHATPWTWTKDNRPQNLTPMARPEQAAKTKRDVKAIAKVRRGLKKRAAGLDIPLAPGEDPEADARHAARVREILRDAKRTNKARKPKARMQYTAMKDTHKRTLGGRVERRAP